MDRPSVRALLLDDDPNVRRFQKQARLSGHGKAWIRYSAEILDAEALRTPDAVEMLMPRKPEKAGGEASLTICRGVSALRFWQFDRLVYRVISDSVGGDWLMAAQGARALFETAGATAATAVEMEDAVINEEPHDLPGSVASIARNSILGTRQTRAAEQMPLSRNVLTTIKKASRAWGDEDLAMRIYELLSDAVHPSLEATGVYVETATSTREGLDIRLQASPQNPQEIAWAISILITQWIRPTMFCLDQIRWAGMRACLANPAGAKPNRNELCKCGSSLKSKQCKHLLIDRWPSDAPLGAPIHEPQVGYSPLGT